MNSWLAKADVLVELTGSLADEIMLSTISNRIGSIYPHPRHQSWEGTGTATAPFHPTPVQSWEVPVP